MRPVLLKRLDPVVNGLQLCSVQTIHPVLPAFDHCDKTDTTEDTEMFGDRRLRHPHDLDDIADGTLLAVDQDADNLAPSGFGDGIEDVGGGCCSCHGEKKYIPIMEYVKTSNHDLPDFS
jgi:hypothetical protein